MRDFRPALGAVAIVLLLIACPNADAGRRCRRAACCDTVCCHIPCWVRVWDTESHFYAPACPPGTKCRCYSNGEYVDCDGQVCDAMTIGCVKDGRPHVEGYRGGMCRGCKIRLYAMMRDPCTGRARFALPCEVPDGWLQLHYLCKPWPYPAR
jgi:hypothetical protein